LGGVVVTLVVFMGVGCQRTADTSPRDRVPSEEAAAMKQSAAENLNDRPLNARLKPSTISTATFALG
jgi:hypothetical protein